MATVSTASVENAVKILTVIADTTDVKFDRVVARRLLVETMQAISGDDWQAWASRLVEVGESVDLRIRSVECTLKEALIFAGHGIPVATSINGASSSQEDDEPPRWIVVTSATPTSAKVLRLEGDDQNEKEESMSIRQLQDLLQLATPSSSTRWIIGQSALNCQAPDQALPTSANGAERKQPIMPLSRLVGILRPERTDLWVVLVFSVFVGVLTLATPVAVEAMVNTVAFGRYLQPVAVLAVLLFTFLVFAAAIRGLMTFIVEILQRRLFIRVVEDLAYRLPRAKHEQFDRLYGPELVNRFFDIVTIKKSTATILLDGISIVLQTAIGMVVLGFYHPFLLGFDVVLLALIAFIILGLGRGAVGTAIKESKAKYAVASWLQELSRHPTAFKLHSGTQFALERADELAVSWLAARRNHFRIVIRQVLFALGLQAFAATALLGLGGWLVISGELNLGQLVASELIVMMIVSSFAKLGKHMESIYDLLASVDKLGQVFDLETEKHDKLFHLQECEPAALQVCGVSYGYGKTPVLKDLSFSLVPGDSVALSGPAGSGKSTLIDLICGLRAPDDGHIELDGIDLRELRPDSLRENLAVSRSVEIFPGTIDENVHLGRPNVRASDVRDALQTAGLLDEVLKLPDGLNSHLQTDGAPLTSSQAARLMLARAIVGRPRLLLIDGTLDSLDDATLASVVSDLSADDTPWSMLVASGRQMVIDACDQVHRMTVQDAVNASDGDG